MARLLIHYHTATERPVIKPIKTSDGAEGVRTKDCGCGGHKKPEPVAKVEDATQKLTRDAGEPVNAAWLKLDRMTPDSLAREARSKGIKDETKTGQVMGILRATFKPVQIDAWSQHF